MNDTGAIYILGGQGSCDTRTLINNNYIMNFNRRYGAVYFDQGSSYINAFNNVVENNSNGSANWCVISSSDTHGINVYNNFTAIHSIIILLSK